MVEAGVRRCGLPRAATAAEGRPLSRSPRRGALQNEVAPPDAARGWPLGGTRCHAPDSVTESRRRFSAGFCATSSRRHTTSGARIGRPRWLSRTSDPRPGRRRKVRKRYCFRKNFQTAGVGSPGAGGARPLTPVMAPRPGSAFVVGRRGAGLGGTAVPPPPLQRMRTKADRARGVGLRPVLKAALR